MFFCISTFLIIALPGPLDLRGMISIILFLRLVIFDKQNIDLIRKSISNKFFILIIVFSLYLALVDFFSNIQFFTIIRSLILNFTALLLGLITILNGYGKKTIVLAILIAGVFATGDLIYSYFVTGSLMIRRIVDVVFSDFVPSRDIMNHNFFGGLCGFALIIAFLLLITKNVNKIVALILLAVFTLGIIISTSRGTFLSVAFTLVMILLTQHELKINFKKIFISSLIAVILFAIIIFSYSYILSAMNIKTEFADQIYWRLVEEPLSFFNDDFQEYGWDNNKIEGTMRWRYNKILRDLDIFFKHDISKILFGFGTGGYSEIGEITYIGWKRDAYQYSAHNFYINTFVEYGTVGLLIFLLFLFSLTYSALKMVKKGWIQISFVYILFAMLASTFGGDPNLTDDFSYILFGIIIAELILVTFAQNQQTETQN